MQTTINVSTPGRGLHAITEKVVEGISGGLKDARMLNMYIQHTSASLLIQENYDPSAARDMEQFLDRLIPDGQSWHEHTSEGPDDTSSHMKAAITATSLTVPIINGRLGLGTWQGIYLWEHRTSPYERKVILTTF